MKKYVRKNEITRTKSVKLSNFGGKTKVEYLENGKVVRVEYE